MELQLVVRGVIKNGDKYLLVKLLGEDFWCLPGGKVEADEDIQVAIKRELVEELGVAPEVGRLLYVHQLFNARKNSQRLEFFFEIINGEDYVNADFKTTSHGMAELAAVEFLPLANINLLPAFLQNELVEQQFSNPQFRVSKI